MQTSAKFTVDDLDQNKLYEIPGVRAGSKAYTHKLPKDMTRREARAVLSEKRKEFRQAERYWSREDRKRGRTPEPVSFWKRMAKAFKLS